MRTPPTNWTTLMAQPHETETRLDIAGVSYYGYDGNGGIWSCETRPMLFDKLSVGNCCSATINLVLVNPQTIPTMAKMELYVRLVPKQLINNPQNVAITQDTSASRSQSIRYSNSIVEENGKFVLAEPINTIQVSYNTYNNANVLAGKYFNLSDTDVTVRFCPNGTRATRTTQRFGSVVSYIVLISAGVVQNPTAWVRKGIYYIDTREWDAQHEFLTITGYDAMLKAEQDFIVPPVILEDWPKTDEEIVEEICTRIGVELDTRTVLDKGYEVQIPAVSSDGKDSDTIREVLGWIGAMYGGNWCITDDGKLRLVPLVPTQTVAIGTDALDLATTPAYDALGIVHLVVSEDAEYIAPQTGGTGRSIEISCPWGTQDMADNILTAIDGYVYQPLTVTTATEANPLWELGDGVTVNGYTSVIAAMPTAFGLKYTADIEAPESEEINHEYPYQDKGTRDIERKIAQSSARLKIDIDAIESVVKGIAKPYVEGTRYTEHSIVYKDGKYYSCNVQTSSATWVSAEWTEQSSGALSSIIKQTMDSLTFSVSSGTNQSTITIKANGVDVASPVVRFSRIEADEVSADDITAGTIDAGSGSNKVKLKGGFDLLDANGRSAGRMGGFVASETLGLAEFSGPSGTTTPSVSLGQLGVGYSDASIAQVKAHTIRLNGGVTIGNLSDPYSDQFIVSDVDDLPDPSDYPDGTIGIVVL